MAHCNHLNSCGLYILFLGRIPTKGEFAQWFPGAYQCKCSLQDWYFAGKGFFQVAVAYPIGRDYIGYRGNLVYTIPWSATFLVDNILLHECPVWIWFLMSPLHSPKRMPRGHAYYGMWRPKTRDVLELTTADGLEVFTEVRFGPFPNGCYCCSGSGHFAKDCLRECDYFANFFVWDFHELGVNCELVSSGF